MPLFYNFLNDYSASIGKPIREVAPDVLEWLPEYHYPGNIRELQHIVERAIILSNDHTIRLNHFICAAKISGRTKLSTFPAALTCLRELEKQTIIQALKKARYIKVQAAKMLNISRQALNRKIGKYGISLK
jgi:transcriptional regulator with PAS, ATPase and Fis domain